MAVVAIGFGVLVWQQRWMSDDGFINIRIVRNLLAGHGPVFNVGERIEAYTSPLWLAVIATLGALGVHPPDAAVGGGLVFSVAGLACAQGAAARLRSTPGGVLESIADGWFVPMGAALYAAIPVAWDYGTSGLENGLILFWLGGTYWAVVACCEDSTPAAGPDRRDWCGWATAALVGLGPLVRPELGLFSIVFFLPLLFGRARDLQAKLSTKRAAKLIGAAGAVPVLYEIWRMGYFAALVPNTAVAKAAFESRWQQGWYYVENFFGLYWLVVPAVVALLFAVERAGTEIERGRGLRVALVVGPIAAGLGHCLYLVRMGGGFMHGRLFLPPLFGMLLPVAVVQLRAGGIGQTTRRTTAFAVLAAWAAVCAGWLRVPEENWHGIGDERGWYVRESGVDHPITVADYEEMYFVSDARGPRRAAERQCPSAFGVTISDPGEQRNGCERVVYVDEDDAGTLYPDRQTYPLRDRVAEHGNVLAALRTGIGIRSLVMGRPVHVVDRAGLASPVAARIALADRGRPGHERQLPNSWFVGRFAAPSSGEPATVSAARRALSCGRLARLDRAVYGDLTVGRFFQNIGESFRLRGIEIPRDPHEAVVKFCGESLVATAMAGGSGGDERRWYCPRGYGLSGIEVGRAPGKDAIASLRPRCRLVGTSEGEAVDGEASVDGPTLGGDDPPMRRETGCFGDEYVDGLRVTVAGMVERVRVECGDPRRPDWPGRVEAYLSAPAAARNAIDGSELRFDCPEGTYPAGLRVRAGALVDAAGLVCREYDEK